tara:strand:- start:1712 stop:1933 length:222 start_codon:yes stop_codon:yes gene_type:complete
VFKKKSLYKYISMIKKPIDQVSYDIKVLMTDIEQINRWIIDIKKDISFIKKYIQDKQKKEKELESGRYNWWSY